MASKQPVSHISDTALWVAIYRAMESERDDAIFRDPYARRLGGRRGEEIVRAMPDGEDTAWPMIVRTAVMDEIIVRGVERDGVDTVLNLASGLDTRAYRLSLPDTLRWIDVDLPDIQDYKEQQLAGDKPVCNHELARVDLTDPDARQTLFDRVGAEATQTLVVTEGLLVYLERAQVLDLASALSAQSSFRWWLIDLVSPRLLKMLQRNWGKELAAGRAPLVFGPAEGTAFFEPGGWHEVEFRAMGEESIRLDRSIRMTRVMSLVARFLPTKRREQLRRMAGFVLLESR